MNLISVNDIANLVKEERRSRGWTQAELSKQAGVSRDWLIGLEKAKASVELGLVLRTIKALGINISATPNTSTSPQSPTAKYLQNLNAQNDGN